MDGRLTILQMKYARIIAGIADKQDISLVEAMDRFYHSVTFRLINDGIADLHCRSDRYLVDEFCIEWDEQTRPHQ
mgnify:CR=1 FL=1